MNNKLLTIFAICAVVVVMFLLWNNNKASRSVEVTKVIETEDEFYEVVAQNILLYKNHMKLRLNFPLENPDMYRIMATAFSKDMIAGSMLGGGGYNSQYGSDGTWHVELDLIGEGSPTKAARIKKRVEKLANSVRDLPDDYSKIKAVHDYLVLSNTYVYGQYGAYTALYHGKTSCTGYAFSFGLLMSELDIPVSVEIGGSHAWNRVYVDGEWYNMDVTWDDGLGGKDSIMYDFFLKSDRDWRDHQHGGATATTSMEVTGPTAAEYYSMFPNYIGGNAIIVVAVFLAAFGAVLFIQKKSRY